ncbi:hypothetical protein [Myxosarcina sp. GI1(2024)]
MSEPFYFANGQQAHNADGLIKLCQQFPSESSQHLIGEDFEKWLTYIGETKLARFATEARQSNLDNRQKLTEFLTKCDRYKNLPSPEDKLAIEERPGNFVDAIRNFFKPKKNKV